MALMPTVIIKSHFQSGYERKNIKLDLTEHELLAACFASSIVFKLIMRISIIGLLLLARTACHAFQTTPSFLVKQRSRARPTLAVASTTTTDESSSSSSSTTTILQDELLSSISASSQKAEEWSDMFGFGEPEAAFYALFAGIRNSVPLGLKGAPFLLTHAQLQTALSANNKVFQGWFDMNDLEKAVNDDFLDADRGSTDNRKGWQVTSVSQPRGNSLRMPKCCLRKYKLLFNRELSFSIRQVHTFPN